MNPRKTNKPKPTKAQLQLRVQEILRIRLDGAEFWDVCEYVREKEQEAASVWELPPNAKPISNATLWRYIGRADKLIAESCRTSREQLLSRHEAQRRNLYAKAVSAGDYRTALAVVKDEAELQGLYPPKKVAPTTPDGNQEYGFGLSDAERLAALQTLYASLGDRGGGTTAHGEDAAD
jgi:hypothetical protein